MRGVLLIVFVELLLLLDGGCEGGNYSYSRAMTVGGPTAAEVDSPSTSRNDDDATAGRFTLRFSSDDGVITVGSSSSSPSSSTTATLFEGVSDAFHSEATTAHAHAASGGNVDPKKRVDAVVMGCDYDVAGSSSGSDAKGFAKSRHVVTLATAWPAVRRFMACARCKLWWMTPAWGTNASEVPAETQFLLLELKDNAGYVVVLPMISADGFRATLSG